MQDHNTLLDLGFTHHPDWDGKSTDTKYYRLEKDGFIFSAHVWDKSHGYSTPFVGLGAVVRLKEKRGIVDRWRDCCSIGSVERKINKIINVHT